MDVRCTRCGTEYEFDDTLISERGTSVRCTQCGFQFKVFPPKLAGIGPDEWVVLTSLGRRVVYRSLRELQNGITHGEVAREDLLARGAKPPKPLGSIAELDPLFVVKSIPERQNKNTLTGVAPPAAVAGAVGDHLPLDSAQTRQERKDTVSGVATPASAAKDASSNAQEQTTRHQTQPMRFGGTRTVYGIGGTVPGEVGSGGQANVSPPESDCAAPSVGPVTRSFESRKPDGEIHEVRAGQEVPPPPVDPGAEPSTNRPPASASSGEPERLAPLVVTPEAEPSLPSAPIPLQPEAPGKPAEMIQAQVRTSEDKAVSAGQRDVALGRTELKKELVVAGASTSAAAAASDPPTERWTAGSAQRASELSARLEQHERSGVDSTSPFEAPVAPLSQVSNDTPPSVAPALPLAQPSSADSRAEVSLAAQPNSEAATAPPARVRTKAARETAASRAAFGTSTSRPSDAKVAKSSSVWRAAMVVGLLALGVLAGMKIVGLQLQKRQPARPQAVASTQPTPASWDAKVNEALQQGDDKGAEELLSLVPAGERDTTKYRALRLRVLVASNDMVWWKLQLTGKDAGETRAQSKQQLLERLEPLKRDFAAIGPVAGWSEQIHAAWLNLCRMQGDRREPNEPALVEKLGQPTTAELRYAQSVSAWVRAGVSDDATVQNLRQARAARLDLGPHVVALFVALVQRNRLDDAKAELRVLASQARPHPFYDDMVVYLRDAERTQTGSVASATAGAAAANGADPAENDSELYAGDYRLRLSRAAECLARNELTRAQKLLRSVLAQRPNDIEALSGMGDVLRGRGDLTQARKTYDRVLALNGNYLPALSGAADLRWQSGDRSGAASIYRRILERVGETPGYGRVAAARLKEFDGASKPEANTANPAGNTPTRLDDTKSSSKRASKGQP